MKKLILSFVWVWVFVACWFASYIPTNNDTLLFDELEVVVWKLTCSQLDIIDDRLWDAIFTYYEANPAFEQYFDETTQLMMNPLDSRIEYVLRWLHIMLSDYAQANIQKNWYEGTQFDDIPDSYDGCTNLILPTTWAKIPDTVYELEFWLDS